MTLIHLKIFIMVLDLGSMTAAAKASFIAQPTEASGTVLVLLLV
jgi:DNA-binding transcriptional LysR family regulator